MATTLGKKIQDIFTALTLLGFLAACAPMSTNVVGKNSVNHIAVHNAAIQNGHNALAKRYEDMARDMQAKANEQKKLLEQYENEHLYGWQSHNVRSHALALIRNYEQAARSNMKEAISHRKMAREPKHNYAIHGTLQNNPVFGDVSRTENN